MTPADNSRKMDCPTVFQKGRKWYMTYLIYDGRGYETWLAKSNELLNWETLGPIMSFSDSTQWDANQKAGYKALQDYQWGGNYDLENAMQQQLELLKAMGCNGIRTAHSPPAPEFLDLCDQMGFLVMDEAFDMWKKKSRSRITVSAGMPGTKPIAKI